MKLFFTIDLEDWYNAHFNKVEKDMWNNCTSAVEKNVEKLLALFDKHDVKAIFFVLGYIAERHPTLVKEISDRGHVLASHGYYHEKLYEMDKDSFRKDLQRSIKLLETLGADKVRYYRAPSWTHDYRSPYLYEVLEEAGISVDSSLQPFKTPLSGVRNAPLSPFYPKVNGRKSSVIEFPVPVCHLGPIPIPFCGGFYFRVLPYSFIRFCLQKTMRQRDCFVYIHPWEVDSDQPKHKAHWLLAFINNYGIKWTMRKLERLFRDFKFSDPRKFGKGYEELRNDSAEQ